MISRLSRDSCRCRFSSLLSSRASIISCTRAAAVVKPTDIPRWQAAKPVPGATWVLPVPLLPTAMTFSRRWMYSQRASSITSALFSDGMAGKSKVSRLFTAGKRGGADPPLHHALVAVYEFQFRQPEQVLGVIHSLGGALRGHLPVFSQEAGQLQFLKVMFQEQS